MLSFLWYKELTVAQTKVLKMDVCLWVQLPRRLDKGVDELAVLFTADTFLSEAEVQLVAKELLIARPTVEDNRKGAIRVNASTESRKY